MMNFEKLQQKKMEYAAKGKLKKEKKDKKDDKWAEIDKGIQEIKENPSEDDKVCESRRKSKVGKWI